MNTTSTCAGCGTEIWQEMEKALDGTWAIVWASQEGWICDETDEEHVPGEYIPMTPVEALTYAILSINTDQAPDATSGADMLYLEANARKALRALAALRDSLESGE